MNKIFRTKKTKSDIIIEVSLLLWVLFLIFTTLTINKTVYEQKEQIQELKSDLEIREKALESLNNQNIELLEELKELKKIEQRIQDNKELRETVKQLSSRGSKPQNYFLPPKPERLSNYEMIPVGIWEFTFYTPTKEECGNNKGITASGSYVSPGYSMAIDPRYWSFGSLFYVEGWGIVEALDSGSAVKGRNRGDICIFDKSAAYKLGKEYRRVWKLE